MLMGEGHPSPTGGNHDVFDNADAELCSLGWKQTRRIVLNTYRKPHPGYLILHRAACKQIARTAEPPVRWTTSDFIKVCATHDCRHRTLVSGKQRVPTTCGHCRPYKESDSSGSSRQRYAGLPTQTEHHMPPEGPLHDQCT